MSVEVVMPQMGESITEGTVSKWLKAVGDKIEKDEAILEISTDKVDAEVPSPSAGTLLEIRHQEGETVEVGTVLAMIGADGEVVAPSAPLAPAQDGARKVVEVSEPEIPSIIADAVAPAPTPNSENHIDSAKAGTSTEVVMPQMGESITEGTVSKWLKSVGDSIDKDEPLLEISTDKVDAEVPSPVAGKLLSINVKEGQTVEVGSVLALVGAEGAVQPATGSIAKVEPLSKAETVSAETPGSAIRSPKPETAVAAVAANGGDLTVEHLRRAKSSPLVRNIAKEHGVDLSRIPGSGISGRVTKNDIMSYLETGAALRPQDLLVKGSAVSAAPAVSERSAKTDYIPAPVTTSVGDRVEKMSVMRKKIADHMTFSKQTSAHVTSVYEIDMTNVAKFRDKNKAEFQSRYGTKLTYMPFIFQAVTNAIRKFPIVNAQVDGENIIYKGDINLGMAVALDWGLIVPVIRKADTLSLSGLALAANDLADRARMKKLNPDEVTGGTFTITNPGVFGGLYGTPIINQPQVAILCVGTIEKRPKVFTSPEGDDYIAIRQMAYFALTYDHRIVDGADAERFLSYMKQYLETFYFSL
ncbi:MAG: 2-oxoglutarate dehydrogenase, E2 component, dihydrolipoamide succinyltransferase [Blastocatellia bacterium]|nr:2-oxoglutarate dehydrogenase, E2 component, dihydrolipoamide succinyltransferase [Blastocatellia bacterium]